MNYAELKTAILACPETIAITGEEVHLGHTFINLAYWINEAENIGKAEGFNIIILDAGEPVEKAIFDGKKPSYMQVQSTFEADIQAKFEAIQAAVPDFKFYTVNTLDKVKEIALVSVYKLEVNDLKKSDYGVYRKADTTIDFLKIV